MTDKAPAPSGLMCDLMANPERTLVLNRKPRFGWIFETGRAGGIQAAYQLQVATDPSRLSRSEVDMWDSGKVQSPQSVGIQYDGRPLDPDTDYCWQVRTWETPTEAGPWSDIQRFRTGQLGTAYATSSYPLEKIDVAPTDFVRLGEGRYFIDFGRAVYGTVRLSLPESAKAGTLQVHLGEALEGPRQVQRKPPGTIRYRRIDVQLDGGTRSLSVTIPPDARNTASHAVRMPEEVGEVLPFRYCELVDCPFQLDASGIRQVEVRYPFNRDAASFKCSSEPLNKVWELCKHTIEATTFCGLYVDGDRERIPYEADAYINQLGHYCVDREFTLARRTHEYLMNRATWPTEWILHSVLMAWADYEHSGDDRSMGAYYDDLKAKSLTALARKDGLISTTGGRLTDALMDAVHYDSATRQFFRHGLKDVVDWPPGSFAMDGTGERDGHVMKDYNTVVNAFHYRALVLMGKIARALGKDADAKWFEQRARLVDKSFHRAFFDQAKGIYVDGEGSAHSSVHSNMFPLAFGLVAPEHLRSVTDFVKSRGMACSVYGAQHLLEALYSASEDEHALGLMVAEHDRGWLNMIRVGSTMTLEAWDLKYKKNLDWNHAWGAAPANIIPRWLMGIRPLEPGFGRILIQPRPGGLKWASIQLPTIRGMVSAAFENRTGDTFTLHVQIPGNMTARIALPRSGAPSDRVTVDAKTVTAEVQGSFLVVDDLRCGNHTLCW